MRIASMGVEAGIFAVALPAAVRPPATSSRPEGRGAAALDRASKHA